jgi:hypothetical protein
MKAGGFVKNNQKGLTIAKTLGYYTMEFISAAKRFMIQAPGVDAIKVIFCKVS